MAARSVAANLLGLVAALVASFAIWHYVSALSPAVHFAACLVPVVLWGLVPLVAAWFGRRRNAAETGIVNDQKRAVLALLKGHKLAGWRARYRLPLFLVLGPAGSGKSSLIEEPGLEMENGVRIGDAIWWIGPDAIFVEATVGAAHEKVVRLVALLNALRPDLPLNSVLLVLSPADLALTDGVEYGALAQATVEAIRELETRTRRKYPLYLFLSKIDLVPGFQEFFDRREPEEREQLWGFSLPFRGLAQPLKRKESAEALTAGFRSILVAIRTRLVEWLSREADPVRCGRINGFGAQVATLLPTLQPMLDALFPEKTRNWGGAPLRGILLTSARQEALSIDPLLPELSDRFAMPRSGTVPPDLGIDDEAHGFFVGGAFRKAVLPEAGLALRQTRRRGHVALAWGAAAAAVILALVLGFLIYGIFDREIGWPAHVGTVLADIGPVPEQSNLGKLPAVIGDLRQLSALNDKLAAAEPVPAYALGLAGHAVLTDHLARSRETLLRNALVPHLSALFETQLVDLHSDVPSLDSLVRLAGSPGPMDMGAVRQWLERSSASVPEELRATFIKDGLAALQLAGRLTVNPAYVDAARRIIAYKKSLS